MSEPRSLTSDLRALQAARKREETTVSAMITMAETVQRVESEQRGLSQSVNLSLGQSQESARGVAKLLEKIAELEATVAALTERIETSSVWAMKMNKWAKQQGMRATGDSGEGVE